MPKLSETLSSRLKKLKKEENNLITRLRNLRKKRSHLKRNTLKLRNFWIRKTTTLMAWRKTLILTRSNSLKRRKRTTQNGKSGKMPKRRDLTTLKKKSKKFNKKTTSFGMSSTSKSKPIGNKSITLTGLSGKWKLRAEKSMRSKEKRRELNMNKRKRNTKSKKNSKNTLDKSSFATNSSNTSTTSRLIITEPMKPVKTRRRKLLTLLPNSLLTLNGRRKRLKFLFQRKPNLRNRPQLRRAKRTKTKIRTRNRNNWSSTFLTTSKTNSKLWKCSLHHPLKKSTRRLKNWEKEKDFSKEDAKRNKFQKKTPSCWTRSKLRSLPQDNKPDKRKLKLMTNSQPSEIHMIVWFTIKTNLYLSWFIIYANLSKKYEESIN